MGIKSILTDIEAELLIQFEEKPGLEALGDSLGRDPTVVSKQLKRISEKTEALSKSGGRWVLTPVGRQLNQLSRDYILGQQAVLGERLLLRIGTNREFGSRVISARILEFQRRLKPAIVSLHVYESGVEEALLSGKIDIGLDCGRPYSPEIMYKRLAVETILPVAAPSLLHRLRVSAKHADLQKIPHVFCTRLKPDRIMGGKYSALEIAISTNDIASARALCLQGVGWAMLPRYAITTELEDNTLVPLNESIYEDEKYGVWCLKSRTHLNSFYRGTCEWLSQIEL